MKKHSPKTWWSTGSGYVELEMTHDQARRVSGTGDMYSDTAWIVRHEMKNQLAKLKKSAVRKTLKEYGAWTDEELKDHKENLIRLVWIAGNDITDELFADAEAI